MRAVKPRLIAKHAGIVMARVRNNKIFQPPAHERPLFERVKRDAPNHKARARSTDSRVGECVIKRNNGSGKRKLLNSWVIAQREYEPSAQKTGYKQPNHYVSHCFVGC